MTCPNITVKMVKLHDTKFWCCDDFKADLEEEGTYYTEEDIEEKPRILRIKYCRYCGNKIR